MNNDIIGCKFGKLKVLGKSNKRTKSREIKYKCVCDCGNVTYVTAGNLRHGNVKSCGCAKRKRVHGKTHTRLYNIYRGMKARCYNKNYQAYKNYGGRCIRICDEWLNDFMNFYNWAYENGYDDNLTIDRIDVNGNYEPNNCKWATRKQQNLNTRQNVYLTYNGKTQTMKEWAEELNIHYKVIQRRHKKGWSDKECLFGKEINMINKYDYVTSELLASYDSIQEASFENRIPYGTIWSQSTKKILEMDRGRGYYFGYEPKKTIKIYCYDNEELELLGVYGSIKEASQKTGVDTQQISYQCKLTTPLKDRKMGCTGLFFVKK